MPPEPLPWDRKDDFRERKHERPSPESSSFGSASRWRNNSNNNNNNSSSTTASYSSSSHYGSSRDFARWGSPDLRRPPGYVKQGGWHPFEEASGHGCTPSRSSDRMLGDEAYRSRGDLRYSRNGRENRSSLTQREWRPHSWEMNNGFVSASGRTYNVNIDQRSRSVDNNMPTYPSNSHSDLASTWDQVQSKDQHDNKASDNNGLNTGYQCERETSLGSVDWKPLKWTRSGSLSSRGSSFSRSSSTRSMGPADSSELKDENLLKTVSSIQSPLGNAVPCMTSAAPSEEMTPRKRPRLGWGEGLAKFEKKKVEGPDVNANRDGTILLANGSEAKHSLSSNLVDKSPRLGFSDCTSPATPSSVACSSSPGVEEKSLSKAVYTDNAISNLRSSPGLGCQDHLDGLSFNLEQMDSISIANLCSSLSELLQFAYPGSMDPSFALSTAMNKLLVWKGDVLKALEMTESEIDLLENELKGLRCELGSSSLHPAGLCSLPVEDDAYLLKDSEAASTPIPQPAPLQIESCVDEMVDRTAVHGAGLEEVCVDVKSEDLYSRGTATSKPLEPLSLERNISSLNVEGHVEGSENVVSIQSADLEPSSSEIDECARGDGIVPVKSKNSAFASADGNLDDEGDDGGDSILYSKILASNKESAREASETFSKLLPREFSCFDVSEFPKISGWRDDPLIKQQFAVRRQSLRFKERVLTIKFKAFLHLWRGDMRLLSLGKNRGKSHKKFESGLRVMNGYKKHRTLARSRFSSSGNVSFVSMTEIVDITSKLVPDSQPKPYRDVLKMPALILEEKEKRVSRFISSNGLVEDPRAVEKEKGMINPWTTEEREIFMDKFAAYGKDFRKIASFLDYKTTADCVEFYYKYHKSDCFEKMKKKLGSSKQGKSAATTYLVSSNKKWNREVNAASLDILGAVSVMAAHAESVTAGKPASSSRILLGGRSDSKLSRRDDDIERSSGFDLPEKETFAADILAGFSGTLSSEAMSSCITSCADPREGYRDFKFQKLDTAGKRSSVTDTILTVHDDTCSDDSCGEMDPSDWSDEERSVFMQALSSYGKDFAKISRCVRTRSQDQCRVFFSKARKCLGLDSIHLSRQAGTSVKDDANGDESDMEDAWVLGTSSAICNDKLDVKMEEGLTASPSTTNRNASERLVPLKLNADLNRSEEDIGMEISNQKQVITNMVSDMSGRGDRLEVVSRDGSSTTNGDHAESQAESVQHSEHDLVSADAEDNKDPSIVDVPMERSGKDMKQEKPSLPETNLNEKSGENCDAHTFDQHGLLKHANMLKNREAYTASSSMGFNNFECLPQVPVELKPAISLLPLENSSAANLESPDPFQDEEKPNKESVRSTLNLEDRKEGHELVGRVDHNRQFSVHSLVGDIGSSQILRGYPLQIPTKKEMDADPVRGQLSEVQTSLKSDTAITNPHVAQGFYFRKCSGLTPIGSVAEHPVFSRKEQKSGLPRTHSRSFSDSEKPRRNGDVKLFGKILATREKNEEKDSDHPRQSSRTSTLDFSGRHNVDGNRSTVMFDAGNQFGLENVPLRSYGFWDRNRIQTGFSSLPDSTILLAKYPAAFANFTASSSKMEQQALQSIVKSNEHNLNGISVNPARELGGSNGLLDYNLYRNCESNRTQPFTLGRDLLSEMQRRNGFESMASLQQQGRGMVGMNVVGTGGVLVGPCTAVSDPVAAMKMHYAKTDQYGGQNGSVTREEQPWKGNGEIGR